MTMFKSNLSKSAEKPNVPFVFLFIAAIAVIFIAVNVYFTLAPQGNAAAPIQLINSSQKSIYLYAAECTNCFALDKLAQQLLPDAERVSLSENRGRELVDKYQITKLPAIISFNASQEQIAMGAFQQREGAYVLEVFTAPFFDVASRTMKGNVSAFVVLPANCPSCMNASALIREINATGFLLTTKFITQGSPEAGALIAKHNLNFLPAFIFSKDVLDYKSSSMLATLTPSATYADTLESISRTSENYLVVKQPFPPFVNLTTSAIEGIVEAIYLTNNNCTSCYNASIHKNAIRTFNIYLANETFVDISTAAGQALVSNYNITAVPTLLMSKGANAYSALIKSWKTIGSIEKDGWLVFRNFSVLGNINYSLVNGTIVTSAP
ncbi:MAG: hypothetical protein V1722_04275 [Candidatus Micrarchaeota archaeon]